MKSCIDPLLASMFLLLYVTSSARQEDCALASNDAMGSSVDGKEEVSAMRGKSGQRSELARS